MRFRAKAGLTVIAVAFFVPPAALGDEAGAQRIRDALMPYVGTVAFEKGALKVTSEAAGYRITFDPAPLLAAVTMPTGDFSMRPISMLVSQRVDGDWDVSGNDPLELTIRSEEDGRENFISYAIGASPYSGIWSPQLRAFSSVEGRTGAGTVTIREATSDATIDFGEGTVRATASATAGGDLDSTTQQSIRDFRETIKVVASEGGGGAFDVTVSAKLVDVEGQIANWRYGPLLDVWSFLVTNFDPEGVRIKSQQEELRTKLRALLPLWSGARSSATLAQLAINLDQGSATLEKASYGIDFDGISTKGDYVFDYAFEGLNVSSPLIPAWTSQLIPRDMRFALTIDDIDLTTPAAIGLDAFDLNDPARIPKEAADRIAATFEGKPISFVIEPSFVAGDIYRVEVDGKFSIRGKEVAMTATVVAAGLDEITKAIQEAGTPEAYQAAGSLSIAKGFGRPLPDGRTSWEIEAESDGAVKVNGVVVVQPKT